MGFGAMVSNSSLAYSAGRGREEMMVILVKSSFLAGCMYEMEFV